MEINYNWEKKQIILVTINTNITISSLSLGFAISIWQDAIIANGAIVNTNKSLLLFTDNTKTNKPIKKEIITFLKEESKIKGLLEREETIDITKNKAIVL